MRIGVPKESLPGERRVALVPDVIRKLVAMFRTWSLPTRVVASPIRTPNDVVDAALAGAHAAAAPASVLRILDAERAPAADRPG